MTREDAIFFLNELRSANNCDETIDMAIAALNEPGSPTTQLDENGLMPCGCGGKAHVYLPVSVYSLYIIGCERCRVRVTFPNKVNEAKNEWNAAMGWREEK